MDDNRGDAIQRPIPHYPLMLDLTAETIFVIGAGHELGIRLQTLKDYRAGRVHVFAADPSAEARTLAGDKLIDRWPSLEDFASLRPRIAFIADVPDADAARWRVLAKQHGALVHVQDRIPLCDFHLPAILRRGSLQITVSTDGAAAGLETGFGLGREVGVYAGAAAAWEKLLLLLLEKPPRAARRSSGSASGRGEENQSNEEEEEEEEEGAATTSSSRQRRRRAAALASVRSLAAAVASFKDSPRDEALSDALDALRSKWRVACASVGAVAAAGVGGAGGATFLAATTTTMTTTTTFEATAEEIRGAVADRKADASSPAALPSLDF